MGHTLKMGLLKVGASLLLAGMAMAALVGQSAFADPCGTLITGDGSSCTITFNAYNPSGVLTYQSVNSVTVSNASASTHIATFSFASSVDDGRAGTAGWSLTASTTGLTTTGGTVYPQFNGSGAPLHGSSSTVIATPNDTGNCGTVTLSTADTTSPGAIFASAATGTAPIDCHYALTTNGYIDFTGQPAGSYTGDVTITLASV
ncbi:MAG TPA: hypothetical protein VL485_05570 [Ktedonobacteraceae bacterium]|jgi:hypothetical protein|nr:hypothetical protein [Ktedonobacteraceae bacterium]